MAARKNCAYDMADCGVGQLEEAAQQIQVNQTGNVYTYQANSTVLLFNFSHFTGQPVSELYQVRLVNAQYRNVSNIFSAVLNLKHNILTVLLRRNVTQVEPFTFTITARINQRMFNFSLYVDVQKEKEETKRFEKLIEPTFNLTQLVQQLEANASLARQWHSPPTESTVTTTDTDRETEAHTADLSLPCNVDIASMGPEVRQKFEQIEHQLNSGLVTGSGKKFFYSQLRQLYADIICNSSTEQTLKVGGGRPESAINQFIGQYLLSSPVNQSEAYRSRRLLDAYADSLIYVNHMYNQVFGVQSRQVVAHMPHYIDVHTVERMQSRFRDHFAHTSASQFRHSEDMQFSFSYFHFLMSETEECNVEEALRLLDTDQSR